MLFRSYEYATEWSDGRSPGISSKARSTTPRRKVRESSLGSAGVGSEGDTRERGRRDELERNEGGRTVPTDVSLSPRERWVFGCSSREDDRDDRIDREVIVLCVTR